MQNTTFDKEHTIKTGFPILDLPGPTAETGWLHYQGVKERRLTHWQPFPNRPDRIHGASVHRAPDAAPVGKGLRRVLDDQFGWRAADIVLALLLAPVAAVVVAGFGTLHLVTIRDGGPFLYAGDRLGKGRKLFKIIKIRSLVKDAEKTIGAAMYEPSRSMELWYGHFIRKTRLDEFPQVWNILKGDMSFVGPRPVRPAVYEEESRRIRSYDLRFKVRPGLTGLGQFLTPHRTDKRIRARIDAILLKTRHKPLKFAVILVWTATELTACTLRELTAQAACLAAGGNRACPGGKDRREGPRERPSNVSGRLLYPNNGGGTPLRLVDINRHAMRVHALNGAPPPLEATMLICMEVTTRRRWRNRLHRIECAGTIHSRRTSADGADSPDIARGREYVIRYVPKNAIHHYLIEKYLLRQSIC